MIVTCRKRHCRLHYSTCIIWIFIDNCFHSLERL